MLDNPRVFLKHLYDVAVQRAQPSANIPPWLPAVPAGRTLVLGAGKAAGAMAHALEALWPADAQMSGLVVTRYHHVPPQPDGLASRIEIIEASHPVPDDASREAAQRMLGLTEGLQADDLVIFLVSGGGSALLSLPVDGLDGAAKDEINRQLLASGAGIAEMNCVRKHLSRVKGGRLALACAPARVVTLAISDVPGDDPAVIASGPTVPDPTSCHEALAILRRYGIEVPDSVRAGLESGALETPDSQEPPFQRNEVRVIATPQASLEAAAAAAREAGLSAYILGDEIEGESQVVGMVHGALAKSVARHSQPFAAPCVILSGGETTVTVHPQLPGAPRGRGGRAGEFCLGLAQALAGQDRVWALAADTDGIDGVEDNAGAFVTPDTLARAAKQGMKLAEFQDRNDAYGYFSALDDLLVTGPTYTNVNDFRAILVL